MNLLAVDTAQAACSAAVYLADGRVVARYEEMSRGHAEVLAPMTRAVMQEAGLGFDKITALGCTTGPGTFSGVRIGLAFARGLAVALRCPLAGMTSLKAVAAPLFYKTGRTIVAAFDARRGEFYLQCFAPDGEALTPPALIGQEALASAVPKGPLLLAGTGAGFLRQVLNDRETVLAESGMFPKAQEIAYYLATHDFRPGQGPGTVSLPEPLYLRMADARLPEKGGALR